MKTIKGRAGMKTSQEFGYAYAKWLVEENLPGARPVDVEKMVGGSQDIPDEDSRAMLRAGISPNPRQYWAGFNSFFEEVRP